MPEKRDKNTGRLERGGFFENRIEEDGLTLTSTRLARLLGLGRSTFYRKVSTGEIDIPFVMLGGERRYLLDTVKDWLKDQERKSMAPKRKYRSL